MRDSQPFPSNRQARLERRRERRSRAEELRASPPLFDSRWLDRLTRVHPILPLVLYGPLVVALLVWGAFGGLGAAALAWAALGYALWTLTEYWLHRVVFHFEPDAGLGRRMHHLIHGVHHDHPNDPRRLVMPPSASIPLAIVFCALFYGVFGQLIWRAVASGFLAGYVVYDMLHYLLHHRAFRGRLGRSLRERHMRHHFQDDTRGFGVSAPYWDAIFGTAPRRRREAAGGQPNTHTPPRAHPMPGGSGHPVRTPTPAGARPSRARVRRALVAMRSATFATRRG